MNIYQNNKPIVRKLLGYSLPKGYNILHEYQDIYKQYKYVCKQLKVLSFSSSESLPCTGTHFTYFMKTNPGHFSYSYIKLDFILFNIT